MTPDAILPTGSFIMGLTLCLLAMGLGQLSAMQRSCVRSACYAAASLGCTMLAGGLFFGHLIAALLTR